MERVTYRRSLQLLLVTGHVGASHETVSFRDKIALSTDYNCWLHVKVGALLHNGITVITVLAIAISF